MQTSTKLILERCSYSQQNIPLSLKKIISEKNSGVQYQDNGATSLFIYLIFYTELLLHNIQSSYKFSMWLARSMVMIKKPVKKQSLSSFSDETAMNTAETILTIGLVGTCSAACHTSGWPNRHRGVRGLRLNHNKVNRNVI